MIQHLHPYDILALGSVTRFHTLRTARAQTLGEHKARVALLGVWLGHRLHDARFGASEELAVLRLALLHDVPETQFGDIPNPAKTAINHWLGEDPAEAEAHDFDSQVDALFWGARNSPSPLAAAQHLPLALLRVADALEAAAFYWQEGQTMRRPGCGHIPTAIVREALGVAARELPELLTAVGEVLLSADVPIDLIEEIEKELAA